MNFLSEKKKKRKKNRWNFDVKQIGIEITYNKQNETN